MNFQGDVAGFIGGGGYGGSEDLPGDIPVPDPVEVDRKTAASERSSPKPSPASYGIIHSEETCISTTGK